MFVRFTLPVAVLEIFHILEEFLIDSHDKNSKCHKRFNIWQIADTKTFVIKFGMKAVGGTAF